MIVTIDGPAGAGKSSIARQAADQLDFEFLDTGALYRAATLAVIRSDCSLQNPSQWLPLLSGVTIVPQRDRVLLGDEDVSDMIRTPEVTQSIVHLADVPQVRSWLGDIQRTYAGTHDIVTEGRDQGTEVFPNAECKIFLTASPEERARRRMAQWTADGRTCTLQEIRQAQDRRDAEDQSRPIGALRPADDAVQLLTDGMTPTQVLERTLEIIRERLATVSPGK